MTNYNISTTTAILCGKKVSLFNENGKYFIKGSDFIAMLGYSRKSITAFIDTNGITSAIKVHGLPKTPSGVWLFPLSVCESLCISASRYDGVRLKNEIAALQIQLSNKHISSTVTKKFFSEPNKSQDTRRITGKLIKPEAAKSSEYYLRKDFYGLAKEIALLNHNVSVLFHKHNEKKDMEDYPMFLDIQKGLMDSIDKIGSLLGKSVFEELVVNFHA